MLKDLNEFTRQGAVYALNGAGAFAYSDGDDVEQYLKSVLEGADDLSSTSAELEAAIRDWPTEYHLSSKRANLLRAFDFTGCRTVLELGSGCGAVTRFLGERGLVVDAIEGSPVRAELTSLRCRGLEGVSVYCGNFNDLSLPRDHYDLIVLIGVAEYAARFMGQPAGGTQPVVAMLSSLRGALTKQGMIVVAIENRTGMKYQLGANEDHYAKPFIGINDYFGARDINTYTLPEWNRILADAGVAGSDLYLPFPDYKLPTVLLSQSFAKNNPYAFCNLEGTTSRDYTALFKPQVRESLLWQSAAASGTLDAVSNSFLFLLSFSAMDIRGGHGFDFAHLPAFTRRREYCLVTKKPAERERVERRRLDGTARGESGDGFVSQRVLDEPYRPGMLLSILWSRALEIEPESDRFEGLVRQYLAYLGARKELSIDLTAANIIVDESGALHAFDEEWVVDDRITPGFLLFRSLLIQVVQARGSLVGFARTRNLDTARDFIVHVGVMAGIDMAANMDQYVATEERFQGCIAQDRTANQTEALLETSVVKDEELLAPVKARVYWKPRGERFAEERCRSVEMEETDEVQTVTIPLPPAAAEAVRMRFNPCEEIRGDGTGYMRIYRMEMRAVDPASGDKSTLWHLSNAEEIAGYTEMTRIAYASTGLGWTFVLTGDDPWFEFPFIPRHELSGGEDLEFVVELRLPRSGDYLLARDRYLRAQEGLESRLREIDETAASCRACQDELSLLKSSRLWPLFAAYRSARQALEPLLAKLALWDTLARNLGPARTAARAGRRLAARVTALAGRRPELAGPPTAYEIWRDKYLRRDVGRLDEEPRISLVMPVYNARAAVLKKAIRSVKRQKYGNWELCIVDDASDRADTLRTLERLSDSRVRVKYLEDNRNISAATNAGVDMTRGDYVAFMDNDDELADNALYEVAAAIVKQRPDVIYTDEDFIRTDNHLGYAHFKPEYNPDLLLSHNYVTHLLAVRRELFYEAGGLRSEYDGAQDYDLVLRLVELAGSIVHIPKPLYHWRMSETSTSLNPTIKPEGHANARKALEEAVRRRNIDATVEEAGLPHYFRVRRRIAGSPLVSIVIPFKDKPQLLERCLRALVSRTTYRNYEVIGISNDSCSSLTYDMMENVKKLDGRLTFRELNIEFNFSKLVNHGVREASGEHVVLLNNDIEVVSPEWIESLLEHSQRDDVAAVGGKLYYPNNTIQHAGIAIGLGGYAGHLHHRTRATSPGYFNRLNVIQNVTAVTGALMMVEKRKYVALGMFDEERFRIAYNDVDFCLRAREAGYLNVFTPYAEAYHGESMSRGYEDTGAKMERFEREKQNLKARHGDAIERGDPYYNPNFDQNRDNFTLPA